MIMGNLLKFLKVTEKYTKGQDIWIDNCLSYYNVIFFFGSVNCLKKLSQIRVFSIFTPKWKFSYITIIIFNLVTMNTFLAALISGSHPHINVWWPVSVGLVKLLKPEGPSAPSQRAGGHDISVDSPSWSSFSQRQGGSILACTISLWDIICP